VEDVPPEITSTFIFDYDGVLTNGAVVLTPEGEPLRTAHVKDGYAIQLAVKKGYNVAVISGGTSSTVVRRMNSLKVADVFIAVESKIEKFHEYLEKAGVTADEVLYMGDDIPDIKAMQEAGVATCPADAVEEVKAVSQYVSHFKGGEGCVRDVIEQVMKAQGRWMNDDAFIW
jgi:3-deoxy-D-manno-octulosonate 8-phosphate phosphatase (KDO 8-P phosphatase)